MSVAPSGLYLDGRTHVRECVARRAVNLRHAAQGVRVLHARVVLDVRVAYLAVPQKLAQVSGRLDLPTVRARVVYALVERGGRAHQGFKDIAPDTSALRVRRSRAFERERADGRQSLRAVEQRESFLGFEPEGLYPRAPQSLAARHALAFVESLALAHAAERQMR